MGRRMREPKALRVLEALGWLAGVVLLALAVLIVLFFAIVFPASQDGPVMWDKVGSCVFCLAIPGWLLLVVSRDNLRQRNIMKKAKDSNDGQSSETKV